MRNLFLASLILVAGCAPPMEDAPTVAGTPPPPPASYEFYHPAVSPWNVSGYPLHVVEILDKRTNKIHVVLIHSNSGTHGSFGSMIKIDEKNPR